MSTSEASLGDSYPFLGRRNLLNLGLALWVPLPALTCVLLLFGWFPPGGVPPDPGWVWPPTMNQAVAFLLHHPIFTVNLLLFVFLDLQFWAIAVVQRNSWLIDPYWTVVPPLLVWFYLAHPLADPNFVRAMVGTLVLLVWAIRLTWNYFRRENWRFGHREDWRYQEMRKERRFFWIEQFGIVHLLQHLLFLGLTLPFWAIAFGSDRSGFGMADIVFLVLAVTGITIAHIADVQLSRFMTDNRARRARGEARIMILETGLWRLSRHPNYFGEQLFWWSVAAFGVLCGEPWAVAGAMFNSVVFAITTVMVERRMRAAPERRDAFESYCRRTSVWLPWWPRPPCDGAHK